MIPSREGNLHVHIHFCFERWSGFFKLELKAAYSFVQVYAYLTPRFKGLFWFDDQGERSLPRISWNVLPCDVLLYLFPKLLRCDLVQIYPQGNMTQHLAHLKPGDTLEVKGWGLEQSADIIVSCTGWCSVCWIDQCCNTLNMNLKSVRS